MEITEEDELRIIELSNHEDIYDEMVASVAPSIYGYDQEKLAMILQLFSGVTKRLPDGSRIRGDLHMLLIGDPGTGKCLKYDTKVTMADGHEREIGSLVEENLNDPKPVDDGVYDETDLSVLSVTQDGQVEPRKVTRVWKRDAPEQMYRIQTVSGREIETTPSHPLFVHREGGLYAKRVDDLASGDHIATPRRFSRQESVDSLPDQAMDQVKGPFLSLPEQWTEPLARLVGYIIGEGYVTESGRIEVTNQDWEILADVEESFRKLGFDPTIDDPTPSRNAHVVRCHSREFVRFLKAVEPAILERSAKQRVPDSIMRASVDIRRAFIKAYVEGESHVSTKEREISVASMSEPLLRDVRSLLLSVGIESQLHERRNGSFRLRISGDAFVSYLQQIGFVTDRKATAAALFDGTDSDTNTDVVPVAGDTLRRIRETLSLTQHDCGVPRTTYQHYERGDRSPSRDNLRTVLEAFQRRLESLRDARYWLRDGNWEQIPILRRELGTSQAALAEGMGVEQTAVSYYERNDIAPDGGRIEGARTVLMGQLDDACTVQRDLDALRQLVDSDVGWDRIESIDTVEPSEDWVYDLEVAGTHTYVSNGIVSHNSQLLSYIRHIAPRSVYTSGKGSCSAGLTAAAVRDDFGDGQQWTLEAGALVLADQGIAAVDELDKMRSEDRSAMHEALEQQSISISKAGINATLKSRCSLLGAANPKYGRFDQYEPIGEQIDLEPALISRFDLIFTVTDKPDEEKDGRLADHILQTNYAGELNTQRTRMTNSNFTQEEVDAATEEVEPAIDPDLLRKYIAHAKRNCYPTMTEEARAAIREFYVDLRARGADEDAPVPVTARKLEALVRLAEASARVRLSDTVEAQDAERVIEIVRSCLEAIGVDPETGEFDVDMVEAGTSKSQRDRIKNLRQLISTLEEEFEEGAPVDEVLDRAESELGLDRAKAESEIEKLRRKGEVYEPRQDHLRTT
ncbi:LAGLIDADG family homing endonuclease [Salinigranum sp. GCM10025319]|uniref:LAGLIDADG family homing endonuclease n=1 Tax=Salinigranum sp. GCM10025319 TaxID=3252687 RepID=UPI00360CA17E